LRRYFRSWKAAGSIPDEVTDLFSIQPDHSSRIISQVFAQSLTE
jgi:hypothetical protein